MLESKQAVKDANKDEIDRIKRIKEDYRNFLQTEGGEDYIKYLTSLTEQYFRGAMNATERDHKATLVDTSSGIMKSLNYISEMGKPINKADSTRRAQTKKAPSKNSPAS